MTPQRIPALDLVRVLGMILVMFLHSTVGPDGESKLTLFLLHNFIANGAVPAFFLLAGYLGARKLESDTLTFRSYARDKARAYIVPYLFWNLLVLGLVLLTKHFGLASHWRGGGTYFDVEWTFRSITTALFGIGRNPIVFQFWFLRDLIVVSLVAWWLRRGLLQIPLLPWFFFFLPVPMAPSLAYYLLGCHLHRLLPVEKFPSAWSASLYLGCWLLMGLGIFLGIIVIPFPLSQLGSAVFIFLLAILLASANWGRRISVLGPATFFIYATHEPLQTALDKCWQAFHAPLYGSLLCFLAIPAMAFSTLILAYYGLSRLSPRLMAVATGERQWAKPPPPAP